MCANRLDNDQSVAETIPVSDVDDWTAGYWWQRLRSACPVAMPYADLRVIATLADSDGTTLEHQVVLRLVAEVHCAVDDGSGTGSTSPSHADTGYYAVGIDYLAELGEVCEPPAPDPVSPDVAGCSSAAGTLGEFHRCELGYNNHVGWIARCSKLASGLWDAADGTDGHVRVAKQDGDTAAGVMARAEAAAGGQCERVVGGSAS